ncbi:MAG: 5-carboxymethyl-2-hydroxymuconate isomerase [Rhizobiaceae bacterium]|nr:5-carboxymethyl-2-hydroxymuconate Delta-isomerase [Hyphomicrobiales bacterium]NRB31894.1 5-carboxymethyl-2-hydroxymuconate isomerase [Rhizobiaceae bacterium]
MPHIIVEHSANLSETHDMADLAKRLGDACVGTGIFPRAGVRVRMHPIETYAMADGHPDNAFIAVIMRIGAGRELEVRQRGGQVVFDLLCNTFADAIEQGFMAISVDMEINDPDMTFKRNGVAGRMKREAS